LAIEKQLKVNKKNIMSLNIQIVEDDKIFSKLSHDRFIRFDNIVTAVGKGISLFEKPLCQENFVCSLHYDDGSFKKNIEGSLQKSADRHVVL